MDGPMPITITSSHLLCGSGSPLKLVLPPPPSTKPGPEASQPQQPFSHIALDNLLRGGVGQTVVLKGNW